MKSPFRKLTAVVLIAATLAFITPYLASAAEMPNMITEEWLELAYTNEARIAQGLLPLTVQSDVVNVAKIRAQEIQREFGHTRPNGQSSFSLLDNISFQTAGENIAAGQESALEVHTSWMESPGHKSNILNPKFDTVGISLYRYKDGYGYYWAQMFTGSSKSPVSLRVEKGASVQGSSPARIEDLGVIIAVEYSDKSIGYCILSKSMVQGYQAGYCADQSITVKFGSASASISLSGSSQANGQATASPASVILTGSHISPSEIKLSWNAVIGATGYSVLSAPSQNGPYSALASLQAGTSYSVTGLSIGATNYYKVETALESGNISSNTLAIRARPLRPSSAGAASGPNTSQVSLNWGAVNECDGYAVYVSSQANGSYSLLETIEGSHNTSVVVSGLHSGGIYYFKIVAYVQIGPVKVPSVYTGVIATQAR